MHDTLYCGKRFRTLNIIDEAVREALAIEVDTSRPVLRVIRVLEQLKDSHPLPEQIRVDNGPELISSKLVAWCQMNGVRLHHIQRANSPRTSTSSASTARCAEKPSRPNSSPI
ncbi:MAG: transposase family protein [Luteolibacter sp.]